MAKPHRAFATLHRLWRDRAGTPAVELALVLPVLLLVVMGIIHFGALFYLQHSMVLVASDLTRQLAIGSIAEAGAVAEAQARLSGWNATFSVTVSEPSANEIGLNITVPIQDAALINLGSLTGSGNLSAQAVMRKEF
jgi:Flp pilus assembly protein TadG